MHKHLSAAGRKPLLCSLAVALTLGAALSLGAAMPASAAKAKPKPRATAHPAARCKKARPHKPKPRCPVKKKRTPAKKKRAPARHVVAKSASALAPLGAPGIWKLRFDDEFNGNALDRSKWQPDWLGSDDTQPTPPPDEHDQSCMDPAQATVSGGSLHLTAVQRSCRADNGVTYGYASALVNTYKSFQFTYGYMEARVYLPASGGSPVDFPAFWADGNGTWPSTGELDVMEVLRDCGPGVGYHFHSDSGGPGECVGLSHAAGWHTFGADWQPGSVTYYYDGRRVGQIGSGITGAPMYLILNNCVDSAIGGHTAVPADVQVDYVRVWQH